MGDSPRHELYDIWKALNPVATTFPTSLNRDNSRAKRAAFACRYDFIFASRHLMPVACDYHFDNVVGAVPRLSDHALVTATLHL